MPSSKPVCYAALRGNTSGEFAGVQARFRGISGEIPAKAADFARNRTGWRVTDQGPIVSGLAGRYASALFELASEQGQIDQTGKNLKSFQELVDGSADLSRLVSSPAFSATEQSAAISSVLNKAGIGGLAGNFIKLAASKRRLFAIRGMGRAYQALADAKAGVVRAEVTVAQTLSPEHKASVKQALDAVTGKDVQVTETIDASLIGGIIVKLGSKMVDASIRTRLNAIKLAMTSAA